MFEGLEVGQPVEVRTRFDGRWVAGYIVNALDRYGYWLERLADGSVLPVPFAPVELRPAALRESPQRGWLGISDRRNALLNGS
jgi:hypothetical protein